MAGALGYSFLPSWRGRGQHQRRRCCAAVRTLRELQCACGDARRCAAMVLPGKARLSGLALAPARVEVLHPISILAMLCPRRPSHDAIWPSHQARSMKSGDSPNSTSLPLAHHHYHHTSTSTAACLHAPELSDVPLVMRGPMHSGCAVDRITSEPDGHLSILRPLPLSQPAPLPPPHMPPDYLGGLAALASTVSTLPGPSGRSHHLHASSFQTQSHLHHHDVPWPNRNRHQYRCRFCITPEAAHGCAPNWSCLLHYGLQRDDMKLISRACLARASWLATRQNRASPFPVLHKPTLVNDPALAHPTAALRTTTDPVVRFTMLVHLYKIRACDFTHHVGSFLATLIERSRRCVEPAISYRHRRRYAAMLLRIEIPVPITDPMVRQTPRVAGFFLDASDPLEHDT
ncbi:hypothetical protein DE146DRAFT_732787 [Phaeosphaeria sp. MPI-PUGE-AT-0046c]|nr:hypothetical protein DE146DRAFT_732787 [Phaeosphaeria sp. MPI-PUGE-AT-0046c]